MPPTPASAAHPRPCSSCTVRRLFCPLPDPARGVLEQLKASVKYAKGDVAFHESDPCHSVFIVCEGSVKLVTASTEGKILLLRFAAPGEVLGLVETILGGTPYECSAIAAEPTTLAVIPRDTFVRFMASSSNVALRVTRALAEQYAAANREAKFLAFGETSMGRLARLLLEWSEERGEADVDGVRIASHATHIDLAQSIGSTRETVTRILGELNHRGIIERRPNEIVIHSAAELARLAAH